jgi:hypothetical protein
MTAWACEGPEHEGDRIIQSRLDRYSKRVSYMRADGSERRNERVLKAGHRCRACSDKETRLRDAGMLQESFEI